MTKEQAQADFDMLIAKNGFALAGYATDTGNPIYNRIWTKQVEVAWQGEQTDKLEVRIYLSYGVPLVAVKHNDRLERGLLRDYSSPKRAMNAIREIVRCAGFEM